MIFLLSGNNKKPAIGIGTNDERLDEAHLRGIYSKKGFIAIEGYYTYNGSLIRMNRNGAFVRYLAPSKIHICPITRMVFTKEDSERVWYMQHETGEQEVWEFFEEVPCAHREQVSIISKETAIIIRALKSMNGPVEEFMGYTEEEE